MTLWLATPHQNARIYYHLIKYTMKPSTSPVSVSRRDKNASFSYETKY